MKRFVVRSISAVVLFVACAALLPPPGLSVAPAVTRATPGMGGIPVTGGTAAILDTAPTTAMVDITGTMVMAATTGTAAIMVTLITRTTIPLPAPPITPRADRRTGSNSIVRTLGFRSTATRTNPAAQLSSL